MNKSARTVSDTTRYKDDITAILNIQLSLLPPVLQTVKKIEGDFLAGKPQKSTNGKVLSNTVLHLETLTRALEHYASVHLPPTITMSGAEELHHHLKTNGRLSYNATPRVVRFKTPKDGHWEALRQPFAYVAAFKLKTISNYVLATVISDDEVNLKPLSTTTFKEMDFLTKTTAMEWLGTNVHTVLDSGAYTYAVVFTESAWGPRNLTDTEVYVACNNLLKRGWIWGDIKKFVDSHGHLPD